MEKMTPARELIISTLREKACTKQEVYKITLGFFEELKIVLKDICNDLTEALKDCSPEVRIAYEDKGQFEAELTFGGDILVFTMHTNIFNFDSSHYVHNLQYVKDDPSRSYCGTIQVYNFLADSFRFNRQNDLGYLIGRLFINKEKHFFVEGKRQLGYIYNDFEKATLDNEKLRDLIESAILFSIDFDLLSPPYYTVQEMTVFEKIQQTGTMAIRTAKRLGFRFEADTDQV